MRPISGVCGLVVLTVLAGTLFALADADGVSAQVNCTVDHDTLDSSELEMLALLNSERAKAGSPPVSLSATASRSAAWMAQDIADHGYFAHAPDSLGRTFAERLRDCGMTDGYRGENLAIVGDPAPTLAAWMASPAHRENMLNPVFRFVGIGRVDRVWSLLLWSEDDGLGDPAASPPQAASASRSVPLPDVRAPLWVNDLEYGSRGGGFYWDPVSNRVWTAERGWHVFAPPRARSGSVLWVNHLGYGSRGGGFYLDPLAAKVWTAERGWHIYAPLPV